MISQGIEPMKLFLKLKRIQPPTHICNMVHDLSRALLTVTSSRPFWTLAVTRCPKLPSRWRSRTRPEMLKKRQLTTSSRSLKTWQEFIEKCPHPCLFFCQSRSANSVNGVDNEESEKVYSFIEKSRLYFMFSKTEDESKRVRGSLWKSFWREKYLKSSKYADNNFWL